MARMVFTALKIRTWVWISIHRKCNQAIVAWVRQGDSRAPRGLANTATLIGGVPTRGETTDWWAVMGLYIASIL